MVGLGPWDDLPPSPHVVAVLGADEPQLDELQAELEVGLVSYSWAPASIFTFTRQSKGRKKWTHDLF